MKKHAITAIAIAMLLGSVAGPARALETLTEDFENPDVDGAPFNVSQPFYYAGPVLASAKSGQWLDV